MYHGQPGFIRYVPRNLPLKLGGFMVHSYLHNLFSPLVLILRQNKIPFDLVRIPAPGIITRSQKIHGPVYPTELFQLSSVCQPNDR